MLNEERNTCVSSLDQLPPCPSPPLTGERHKRIRREQVTALLTPEHPDVVVVLGVLGQTLRWVPKNTGLA